MTEASSARTWSNTDTGAKNMIAWTVHGDMKSDQLSDAAFQQADVVILTVIEEGDPRGSLRMIIRLSLIQLDVRRQSERVVFT